MTEEKAKANDLVSNWSSVFGLVVLLGHFYWFHSLTNQYFSLPDKTTMDLNFIKQVTPILLSAVLLEVLFATIANKDWYRFSDGLCSMCCGLLMVALKRVGFQIFGVVPYQFVWSRFCVTNYFDDTLLGWVLMFFVVEWCYYWCHRSGHTVHFMWAMHSVHHSSEEYNLTTSLRQPAIMGLFAWAWYVPFALFFPPLMFEIQGQFNFLYQFWLHTYSVGKLGPLEYIFNTPSQHRVHHARNKLYIDKNYGGTTCIFDRLFNTYQEEEEEKVPIVMGVTTSINTFNAWLAQWDGWKYLLKNFWKAEGALNHFLVFYYGPGWKVNETGFYSVPPVTNETAQKYDPYLPFLLKVYVLFHFLVSVYVHITYGEFVSSDRTGYVLEWLTTFFLLYSVWCFGCIFDRSQWAVVYESVRLGYAVALVALVCWVKPVAFKLPHLHVLSSSAVVGLLSFVVLLAYRNFFTGIILESEKGKRLKGAKEAEEAMMAKYYADKLQDKEKDKAL